MEPIPITSLHLKYIRPSDLTILRKKRGQGFRYFHTNGKAVTDQKLLTRIKALVLPPAWTDVRICAVANGHLQAIGRDARGRLQYRYHEKWHAHRNQTKFHRMADFANALPAMRAKIREHLAQRALNRTKVLAAAVEILQRTNMRVGNEIYTKTNHSHGLTTLRNQHALIRGSHIHFHFRAKSGKIREIDLDDPVLSRVLRKCQDLPGQVLFEYRGDDGLVHRVSSCDINRYIQELSGEHFTAKDFRTWCGTVHAVERILELGELKSAKEREWKKRHIAVVRATAEYLGNTPTICKKYYIHPEVFEADRTARLVVHKRCRTRQGLRPIEVLTLSLCEKAARIQNAS